MLSRKLQRVLLDSRWPVPPTFLLPWAAHLTTVAQPIDVNVNVPPPSQPQTDTIVQRIKPRNPTQSSPTRTEQIHLPNSTASSPPAAQSSSPALSPSIRELPPLLTAQGSHYITLHIHGKPYLVTQGDTVRLPFLMHGVEPGDVLRMNRAVNIGSRDYTMKASAAAPKLRSSTMRTVAAVDPTTGSAVSTSRVMPSTSTPATELGEGNAEVVAASPPSATQAPHFVPHIEQGKHSYLDERLFVCRAVVLGLESEPLRIMEKTKRRNRKVKKVKSKLRFTVLKVKEVRVRDLEELEREVD